MDRKIRFATTVVAEAVAVLALAACGGGSGGADGPATAAEAGGDSIKQAQAAGDTPNVVVRAWGSLAGNVGPVMQLRVNGTVVGSVEVRAAAYENYSFSVPPIAAGAKVELVFNNDGGGNGEDRNLFVESVTINGVTTASTAAGVTFDRGPNAQAFDGQDVLPGLATLWWNGALRFTASAGPVAASRLSPACAAFYASNPGFALSTDRTALTAVAMNKPNKNATFSEPNFKTCVTRATDHNADGLAVYARTEYSRRQVFNADNTRQLVLSLDGYFHLYDAYTHALLKKFPSFGVDPEIQWHPTNPDLFYYAPSQGSEMALRELNVVTGVSRVVGDFKARVNALFSAPPGITATNVYTRSEGSPSKDGRYWCFMVRDAAHSVNGNWRYLGVFTWDRDTDTILGSMPLNGDPVDHVSMSPSGKYCVVSSAKVDGSVQGTRSYSLDFKEKRQLFRDSEHSDLAIDANGDDVYVYVDSMDQGDVFMTNLRTGENTKLLGGLRSAAHFSGKAFNKPGWVVLSTQAPWDGAKVWMQNRLMAVQLKANPTVYNLAFHRTNYSESAAPTATVNRDFTRVAYNSNWGNSNRDDVDTYNIEIPADALKDGVTAPAPVPPAPVPPPPPAPAPAPVPAPPPPAPAPSPLNVTVANLKRSSYVVTYTATTSQPAKCGSAWVSGQPYDWLYDLIAPSANGLTHNANIVLDTASGAKTIYLVCKATASGVEKEVAIQVN